MSHEIVVAKRRRQYLERIWRRTRSPLDRSRYTKQLHICNYMMSKAKPDYYTHFISINSENPRQMWKSVNTILHRQKLKAPPEHSSLDTLCSSFSKYFTDKIARIRSTLSLMIMNMVSLNHQFLKIYYSVSHLQLLMKFSLLSSSQDTQCYS